MKSHPMIASYRQCTTIGNYETKGMVGAVILHSSFAIECWIYSMFCASQNDKTVSRDRDGTPVV